jgi:hypothetical protein
MSSSSTGGIGLHFVVATAFTVWVVVDSLKRKKLAWGYAVFSFLLMWWICLPFYFAGRKLLPGETREGGYGWNVCKFFLLLWTVLLGYCLIGGIINVSENLDGRQMSDAAAAGAAIGVGLGLGMFFCLYIGVAIPVLITGLLLKKSSVIETGTQVAAATTHITAAPAGPSGGARISVARQGKNLGNFEESTFRQNVASGLILPSDHYWKKGMAGWELVSNYRG